MKYRETLERVELESEDERNERKQMRGIRESGITERGREELRQVDDRNLREWKRGIRECGREWNCRERERGWEK